MLRSVQSVLRWPLYSGRLKAIEAIGFSGQVDDTKGATSIAKSKTKRMLTTQA